MNDGDWSPRTIWATTGLREARRSGGYFIPRDAMGARHLTLVDTTADRERAQRFANRATPG
jgi:hypothetical protein